MVTAAMPPVIVASDGPHSPFLPFRMNDAAKPVWFILFVVLGLAAVVMIARSGGGTGDGKGLIAWQSDVAAAKEQSARDGKPVLMYFTAGWCPPCQKMKSSTWLDSQVAAVVNGKYIPVMVDVDQQRDVASAYGVQGIPRVEVITPNGERQLVTEGYLPAAEMAGALR